MEFKGLAMSDWQLVCSYCHESMGSKDVCDCSGTLIARLQQKVERLENRLLNNRSELSKLVRKTKKKRKIARRRGNPK